MEYAYFGPGGLATSMDDEPKRKKPPIKKENRMKLTIINRLRLCFEILTIRSGHKHSAQEKILSTFLRGYEAGLHDKAIEDNGRFDKLTNLDISTHYRNETRWFMKSDIIGAFAYWVAVQSPYDTPDITSALTAWGKHLTTTFPNSDIPVEFSYEDLNALITEDIFESIPEVEILSHRKNGRDGMGFCSRYDRPDPDDDFIDLGALARNIFYMVMRESITQA